ncbi:MAG: chromosome segregation protein SMC [Pseudomonadota bacterium]
MRLKAIKLSGFKSFVDQTSIPINGNLTGIVGPNGCGKSNIIDAIRWVMGETSASRLRGDSLADVVFNGSSSRKPVGQATVELLFDNSEGRAGGEYAKYSEISIRREAGRDGQSDYFLNRTRCRRKDITDLFLGTGLGPRAYSIIEQGMVTRIIEAKPEDLRGFIEEAAGISRYKERRRETETRIRHTRENLDRVNDIRREIETQIGRLEKQSKAAARFKELKQEERLTRAQLGTLRYRDLDERVSVQDRLIAQHQNAYEAALATVRATEAQTERARSAQTEANERYNGVHSEFYTVGGEISRLEQAIEHARETRSNHLREQEQLELTWKEASAHRQADDQRRQELTAALEKQAPQLTRAAGDLDESSQRLRAAENKMHGWQETWQAFTAEDAQRRQAQEMENRRRIQLEQQISDLESRRARLVEEMTGIDPELAGRPADHLREEAQQLDFFCDENEKRMADIDARLRATRESRERLTAELDELRQRRHVAEARQTSLREMQLSAAEEDDAALGDWLREHRLDQAPRLASRLTVDSGWERAVERVLGPDLVAVCVPALSTHAEAAERLQPAHLAFIEAPGGGQPAASKHPALLDRVHSEIDLAPLLAGIYLADSLADAMSRRASLAPGESLITRDGAWVGRNWLSLGHERGKRAGWLAREREIELLERELGTMRESESQLQARLESARRELESLERERDDRGRQLQERSRDRIRLHEQIGHQEARRLQLSARHEQIVRELAEIDAWRQRDRTAIAEADRVLKAIETSAPARETEHSKRLAERDRCQTALEQARLAEAQARERRHQLDVEHQSMQTALDSTRASLERLSSQLAQFRARRDELAALLSVKSTPEEELRRQLDRCLQQRLEVEGRLTAARTAVTDAEQAIRDFDQQRHTQEREAQEVRGAMEAERMTRQELLTRRDTQIEQVREGGFALADLLPGLPAAATEEEWTARLQKTLERIERLGPINLVAIEEYEEQASRKEYLDKQHADLTEALTTLAEAIRKMDRETRTLFKDTFDKVNVNFQEFFPKLFGGGSAYLELTDNDLLEAGVSVMARPPGKRNSTIHLLSGGEKALAAVALIFSIFQLNPAPFCLLDEVDAPLDDANVHRYSQTLKALSERTQLVFVTHNKISMEMAEVLIGVTMSEPGVSRLVAVDVEEALRMVVEA